MYCYNYDIDIGYSDEYLDELIECCIDYIENHYPYFGA